MPDDAANNTTAPVLLEEETLDLSVEHPAPGKYLRPALQGPPPLGFSQPNSRVFLDAQGRPQSVAFTTPSTALESNWDEAQEGLNRLPAYYCDQCWAIKPQGGFTLPLHLDTPGYFTLTFALYLPTDQDLATFHQAYAEHEPGWEWQTPVVVRLNEGYEIKCQLSPEQLGFNEFTTPLLPLDQLRTGENTIWLGTNHTAFRNMYVQAVKVRRYDKPLPDEPPARWQEQTFQATPEPDSMQGWLDCAQRLYAMLPYSHREMRCYALNVEIRRVLELFQQEATRAMAGPGIELKQALVAREAKLKLLSKYLLRLLGIHAAAGKRLSGARMAASPGFSHFFKESVIFKKKRLQAKKKRRPKLGSKSKPAAAAKLLLASAPLTAERASLEAVPAVFVETETLDLSMPTPPPTKRLKLTLPEGDNNEYYYSDGCWAGREIEFTLQLDELDQCTLTFDLFIPDDPAVRALYQQNPTQVEDASDWQIPVLVSVNGSEFNLPVNPLGRNFIQVTTSFLQRSQLEIGENSITLSTLPQTIKHLIVRAVTLKRFSVQKQEQSQWCWAAVCASLVSLLSPDTTRQEAVVQAAFANTKLASAANSNRPFDIEEAAHKLGLEVLTTGRQLHLYELREGLDLGLPIPLQMNWKKLDAQGQVLRDENDAEILGSGHYVVLTEIEDDNQKPDGQILVTVEDPMKGTLKMTFDELKEDYPGAANQHFYSTPHRGHWSYTHCIFPALVGTRERRKRTTPRVETWAERVKFARQWAKYQPGQANRTHWRALQAEIDQLLAWTQQQVERSLPFELKEEAFEARVERRARNLKAIRQHLLRLLSTQGILQNLSEPPRTPERGKSRSAAA